MKKLFSTFALAGMVSLAACATDEEPAVIEEPVVEEPAPAPVVTEPAPMVTDTMAPMEGDTMMPVEGDTAL